MGCIVFSERSGCEYARYNFEKNNSAQSLSMLSAGISAFAQDFPQDLEMPLARINVELSRDSTMRARRLRGNTGG